MAWCGLRQHDMACLSTPQLGMARHEAWHGCHETLWHDSAWDRSTWWWHGMASNSSCSKWGAATARPLTCSHVVNHVMATHGMLPTMPAEHGGAT